MKILVVDDDKMLLTAIAHYLKSSKIEVLQAENSLQALDILENQNKNIGLILCDILMPGASGLDFLSLLKSFYLEKIPIIIISSLGKSEIIASSKKLGAVDYLKKPLNFKELGDLVKKYI